MLRHRLVHNRLRWRHWDRRRRRWVWLGIRCCLRRRGLLLLLLPCLCPWGWISSGIAHTVGHTADVELLRWPTHRAHTH